MKKEKLLRNAFLIALIVWIVMLIKQQINISHYRDDIKELSSKIEVAQSELEQNKQNLEQVAREKLGMYLPNERVYIDSNK